MGYSNRRASRRSRLSESIGQTHQSAVRFNTPFEPKGYPIRQSVPEHRPNQSATVCSTAAAGRIKRLSNSPGCSKEAAVLTKRLSERIDQPVESDNLLDQIWARCLVRCPSSGTLKVLSQSCTKLWCPKNGMPGLSRLELDLSRAWVMAVQGWATLSRGRARGKFAELQYQDP